MSPEIWEFENRNKTVPVTFSFRRNLDIRHRPPDRMGQGVTKMAGDIPLVAGFQSPRAVRTAPQGRLRQVWGKRKGAAAHQMGLDRQKAPEAPVTAITARVAWRDVSQKPEKSILGSKIGIAVSEMTLRG